MSREEADKFAKNLLACPSDLRDDMCIHALSTPGQNFQILRKQEERLRLLRHASMCKETSCMLIPNCLNFQAHWRHVVECKQFNECRVPECISSRYVLSKYAQYIRRVSETEKRRHSPKNFASAMESYTYSRYSELSDSDPDSEDEEAAAILLNLNSPKNEIQEKGFEKKRRLGLDSY